MADVDVTDVIETSAGTAPPAVRASSWAVQFLGGERHVVVAADIFQIEPSNSTVVLQLNGEVVFTAPLGGVQYVQKVVDRQ